MSMGNRVKPKEINLYLKYSYDPEAEARKRTVKMLVLPLVCLVAAFAVAFAVIMVPALIKNSKISDYEAYTTNPAVIQQYTEAKSIARERDSKCDIYTELDDLQTSISESPTASRAIMDEIRSCLTNAEASGYQFESGDGLLAINLSSDNVTALPIAVTRLRQTGEFARVNYSGYQGSDKKYSTTITCVYK